jgi:hypothetical protein
LPKVRIGLAVRVEAFVTDGLAATSLRATRAVLEELSAWRDSRLALAVVVLGDAIAPATPFPGRVIAVTRLPPFFNLGTEEKLAHPRGQAALFI